MPRYINETSGLEYYKDYLVTHNDSGNEPVIYYLDREGRFSFKRSFDSLTNHDWEDLTSDKDFLYIADMGNNFDTRKNLQIVKVPIDPKIDKTEFINFYYPEQSEFEFRLSSMYDAEGLISIDDYLLIFTKNRAKKITEIYKISKSPGSQIAEKIGSLDIQSIVTGADYHKDLTLNLGNSGTGMRLLAGYIAGFGKECILIGDKSLSKRPMDRIAEPLKEWGADIELTNQKYSPIKINPSNLVR